MMGRLELWQASLRFTTQSRQALADFMSVLSHAPDAVGFTEATRFHDELWHACRRTGHQLVLPTHGDTAIAVWEGHEITGHGYETVNPASAHPLHTERGVQWVTFDAAHSHERITACAAHWLTQRADTPNQKQRLAMTEAMGDVVARAAKGHRLGFWMGDTNNPDRSSAVSLVDKALRKADLTSCWDELGRYPDTHGDHTLDVVGSYDPDRRATCLRARRWPQLHSDHRPISAVYHLSPVRKD